MGPVKLEVITPTEEMAAGAVPVDPARMAQVKEAGEETVSLSAAVRTVVTADKVVAAVPLHGTAPEEEVELEDMVQLLVIMVTEETAAVAVVAVMAVGMLAMAAMVETQGTVTSRVITATAVTAELVGEAETAGAEPVDMGDMGDMVLSLGTMPMVAMAELAAMGALDPRVAVTEAVVVTAILRVTMPTAGTVEPEEMGDDKESLLH